MNPQVQSLVAQQRASFLSVARKGFDSETAWHAESGFAMQILTGNDLLMKIALGNPDSIKAAITNVAAIGISLNPASKEAYLVPRKGKVCLDISYMGLLHMAMQDGCITWGQSRVVRDKDVFEMRGLSQEPDHRYNPFNADRGEIVGAYVVVKLPNGDYLTHAMAISAIHAIRARSESFLKKSGPWITDEEEMVKKTCIKQASKTWPKSPRLEEAIQYMDTDGGEGIRLDEKVANQITDAQVAAIKAGLKAKGKTWEDLKAWCLQVKQIKREVDSITDLDTTEAAHVITKALSGVNPS